MRKWQSPAASKSRLRSRSTQRPLRSNCATGDPDALVGIVQPHEVANVPVRDEGKRCSLRDDNDRKIANMLTPFAPKFPEGPGHGSHSRFTEATGNNVFDMADEKPVVIQKNRQFISQGGLIGRCLHRCFQLCHEAAVRTLITRNEIGHNPAGTTTGASNRRRRLGYGILS